MAKHDIVTLKDEHVRFDGGVKCDFKPGEIERAQ
jgi:hypothetical protein